MINPNTMRRITHHFAKATLWLMMPLTLVGGLPHLGCHCPNGNERENCAMLWSRAILGSASPSCCCKVACGSPACASQRSDEPRRGCCRCQDKDQTGANMLAGVSRCGCSVSVRAAQLLPTAKIKIADAAWALLPIPAVSRPAENVFEQHARVAEATLPPPDLLALYQVFVI